MSYKRNWLIVFIISGVSMACVIFAPFALDDAHLSSSSFVLGRFALSQRNRTVSLHKNVYGLSRIDIVYSEGGNIPTYKVRLWQDKKIIGDVFSGHPGYLGFKNVDGDKRKEIIVGGFGRKNILKVYKVQDGRIRRISPNRKARLLYTAAKMLNAYGLWTIAASFTMILVSIMNILNKDVTKKVSQQLS